MGTGLRTSADGRPFKVMVRRRQSSRGERSVSAEPRKDSCSTGPLLASTSIPPVGGWKRRRRISKASPHFPISLSLAFQQRYSARATPFAWRFTRDDLHRLLNKLSDLAVCGVVEFSESCTFKRPSSLTPRPNTRLQPFRFPRQDQSGKSCLTEESIHELLGLTHRRQTGEN